MTLVINVAVGGHYLLQGPMLPSQFQNVTAVGLYQFMLLGERVTSV